MIEKHKVLTISAEDYAKTAKSGMGLSYYIPIGIHYEDRGVEHINKGNLLEEFCRGVADNAEVVTDFKFLVISCGEDQIKRYASGTGLIPRLKIRDKKETKE